MVWPRRFRSRPPSARHRSEGLMSDHPARQPLSYGARGLRSGVSARAVARTREGAVNWIYRWCLGLLVAVIVAAPLALPRDRLRALLEPGPSLRLVVDLSK